MVTMSCRRHLGSVYTDMCIPKCGTHEDERTVLFKTISLDGTKPNSNIKNTPKTNPNTNTNPIQLFYAFLSNVIWSSV